MRELPFPEDLLRPRDNAPMLYVPAQTWKCGLCDPDNTTPVANSTVVWLGSNTDGPSGRCSTCGQKYMLAHALDKHIPTLDEQMGGPPDVHP